MDKTLWLNFLGHPVYFSRGYFIGATCTYTLPTFARSVDFSIT